MLGQPDDIAVVIPVRNAAPWIAGTIASTLAQSYPHFRLHLIDDGSTDHTAAIAAAAADGDPRMDLFTIPASGITAALNVGLARVAPSATFIARMDGDDLMHPDRFARQLAFLRERPDIDVLGTSVQVLRDHDLTDAFGAQTAGMDRYVAWLNGLAGADLIGREMFVEAPVCHPSVMMRAEAIRAVGGYQDHVWTEDYDLWLRLHLRGHRFWTLPDVLHTWRDHGRRVTRTDARCGPDRFFLAKAHYLTQRFGKRFRIWGAGRDGTRLARALEGEGAAVEVFYDVDPRKIGRHRRGGAPVRSYTELCGPDGGAPILAAVGIARARSEIRGMLSRLAYVEGTHYVCAA